MKEARIIHNEDRTISVSIEYEREIIDAIRRITGRWWDAKQKMWTLPGDKNTIIELRAALCGYNIIELAGSPYPKEFEILVRELESRKYSNKTIKAYTHYNRQFYSYCAKSLVAVTKEDVLAYLSHLSADHGVSESSINIAISALKFFYGTIINIPLMISKKRPKKDKRLPNVLGKEETLALLNALPNIKHRTILYFAYSGGLRVSEISRLRVGDIDCGRKVVYVRRAKGRKDRYTLLADKTCALLSQYIEVYKPGLWLFEGQAVGKPLTVRSMEKIFKKACCVAGISKDVSIHCLRHSFATHLLENGTDIKCIQELLGHAHLKTTEIYTHVARKNVLSVRSPLDTL
jgi:integrase/recombinase XerD